MKKVIIIGGGISGLTAGIYAQQHGFQTEIYEKNPMPGGECTGWNRHGYHIDNCIHWLTGCRKQDSIRSLWENIGALGSSTKLYYEPCFYMLDSGSAQLHFWRDLEKSRQEFLAFAPEDEKELNKFFDSVKLAESVKVPWEKSLAEMNPFEYMRFGMGMASMGKVMKEYGNDSVHELANRFQNPLVRDMFRVYFLEDYKAITLITSYAFYTSGTAAIPEGGSVGMVSRILQRYTSLGGKLHTNSPVKQICIQDGTAHRVVLENGEVIDCDHVICACDPKVAFGRLLKESYMDPKLREMYKSEKYMLTSNFHVSFGISGEDPIPLSGSVMFPCERYTVGKRELEYLGARVYDYEPTLFPAGKQVIQCNIMQTEQDYDYWQELYRDKEHYREEKMQIAANIEERLTTQYPSLKGRLKLLDVYSPVTFTRWCGAYKGAYMSFFERKGSKSPTFRSRIKGLKNVFFASQWTTTNGGLPIAAASGKFAVDALLKADKFN